MYVHKNLLNGKEYCGITCQKPEYRWRENGKGYLENPHFTRAIQKYGWDSFDHIIIYSDLSKEEACSLEQKYISEHNLTNPDKGYNQTGGGDGMFGFHHSEETKKKMSESRSGHIVTEDARRKISNANSGSRNGMYGRIPWNLGLHMSDESKAKVSKNRAGKNSGENHPMYGKKHSEEAKRKISEANKGRTAWNKGIHTGIPSANARSVSQYDKDWNLIKVYRSVSEAARAVNSFCTGITKCCQGKAKHAAGYYWKYYEEEADNRDVVCDVSLSH